MRQPAHGLQQLPHALAASRRLRRAVTALCWRELCWGARRGPLPSLSTRLVCRRSRRPCSRPGSGGKPGVPAGLGLGAGGSRVLRCSGCVHAAAPGCCQPRWPGHGMPACAVFHEQCCEQSHGHGNATSVGWKSASVSELVNNIPQMYFFLNLATILIF